MYIHMCWSHFGRPICAHTQELRHHWYVHYMRMSGWHFFGMEDRKDSLAGPLQCTYLAELNAETRAEHCQWLAKKSVHCRSQRKNSKVESTYWRVFTSQLLGSLFTLLLFCTVLWAHGKPAMHNFWYLLRTPHPHAQCTLVHGTVCGITHMLTPSTITRNFPCHEQTCTQSTLLSDPAIQQHSCISFWVFHADLLGNITWALIRNWSSKHGGILPWVIMVICNYFVHVHTGKHWLSMQAATVHGPLGIAVCYQVSPQVSYFTTYM